MRTLKAEMVARAQSVKITADDLVVGLSDGRVVSIPLAWFPRLLHATVTQRKKWEILGDGEGIHWPLIDEDISVSGLLRGIPAPAETPKRRAGGTCQRL